MRKFLFVALAVVATACSDPIAYEGTPPPPPPPDCPPTCSKTNVAVESSMGTTATVRGVTAFGPTIASNPAAPYTQLSFTGLLDKGDTVDVQNLTLSATDSLTFDLYVLGSWDGSTKQAQHGNFTGPSDDFKTAGDGLQVWCGANLEYATTFSNQKTVSQHYPEQVGAKTTKAGSGAIGYGDLGFTTAYVTAHYGQNFEAWVPLFQSVGDSRYHLTVYVPTDCFHPTITVTLDQPLSDEAWGISNVSLQ